MKDLTVTLIQTDLTWEDPDANLNAFTGKINNMTANSNLILLPEMFSTGFSMNAEKFAVTMTSPIVQWLQQKASETGADIAGTLAITENKRYYNRLLWAKAGGQLLTYDKRHLFPICGEEKIFSPGQKKLVAELNGWNIAPFICYDLRFPVWTRNFHNGYDLAVFLANWPVARISHWISLLIARAIENQAYVIGVNRVGKDGNGFNYCGESMVVDPKGQILFQQRDTECVASVTLSYELLKDYRIKLPFWRDADVC